MKNRRKSPSRSPRKRPAPADKLAKLEGLVARCGGALVAFSGGVDSTFLLSVAKDALGANLLAVTVAFPAVPAAEVRRARALARSLKARHLVVRADDVADMERFRGNPPDRCYHCKKAILSKLATIAQALGFPCILEASNVDDLGDYRPGRRAVKELGARSPLVEAGITKADIRALSKARGLPTWNKPSAACLASRIPYGDEITREKLARIEKGESYLAKLGFSVARLRHHGELARIEVPAAEIPRLASGALRGRIAAKLKALGFRYITFDLEGYRSGSLNEALPRAGRKRAAILKQAARKRS
jgi:pyridinium-3,5-biscarboxylic acid mononucleotide sulfurtransferase